MLRSTRTILLLTLLFATATSASAQLPISARLGVVGGIQDAKITANAPGVELGSPSTTIYTVGAELAVGLPIGLHLGAYYQRHFGDISGGFDENVDALDFSLGANELGGFVEKQFTFLPLSPIQPFLGAGAGYGRVSLSQGVDAAGVDFGDLEATVDVYRLYAMGGLTLPGGFGAKLRMGYAFGSIDGDDLIAGSKVTLPGGDEVSFEIDYGGLYSSLTVSIFGF